MAIEGCYVDVSRKELWICQLKGFDTMPIERLVMRPIERPFVDVIRKTLCRCQSKSLLEMPIERHLVESNQRASLTSQSKEA